MFLKFIFIAIFLFALDAKAQVNNNEDNKIYSLDEINADLLSRKKELEGFSENEVKVDLESLGLDDVEQKKDEKVIEQDLPPIIIPKNDKLEEKTIAKSENNLSDKQKIIKQENKDKNNQESGINNSSSTDSILSRIQTILKSNEEKKTKSEVKITKEKPQPKQYINKEKRTNIEKKKKLKAQKDAKIKAVEAKEKRRIKKLDELRKKYLDETEVSEEPVNYLNSSNKIIPRRKNLNKFILEEAPPKPLIEDYRTQNNLHIPLMLKPQQRIEILFEMIRINSVDAFNEAYNYIRNPNIKNRQGDSLLTYAIILQKYQIIASIIAKGADLNLPNSLGYTPMHIAIILSDFKTIELLANNDADLNYTDAAGQTYLIYAVRAGNLSAVELFVRKGVDINQTDNNGLNSLSIAYASKQEVIAQFLIKNGAKSWIERPYENQENSLIEELENRWK